MPVWNDPAVRALAAEGPLFEALLDQRTRALAQPPQWAQPPGVAVLECRAGAGGRWAVPLDALAAVTALPPFIPLPGRGAPVLGLTMEAGSHRLVLDLAALAEGGAGKEGDGHPLAHALVLRGLPVILAVGHAQGIRMLHHDPGGGAARMEADGLVLLDPAALVRPMLTREAAV